MKKEPILRFCISHCFGSIKVLRREKRQTLGEAQFNDFMDLVFEEHADEITGSALAASYGFDPDAEMPENARLTKQRELAEEWLARKAEEIAPLLRRGIENAEVGRWRKFIGRIRQFLAEHRLLPKSYLDRLDDRTLTDLLRRTLGNAGYELDAVREDGGNFENSGNDGRAAIDEDGNYFPGPDEWGTAFTSYSGRGLDAVYFLIKEQRGWVPAAFHRDEIGDIDIVYGKTETGFEDKGGYGLAHIAKRRSIDWKLFADTIENGNIVQSGRHRINIIDGKAKIIIELEWKGQKNNWVVSAMGNDLTLTADSLLASNPAEAAKQGIVPKGIVNIGDIWDDVNSGNKKNQKNSGMPSVDPAAHLDPTLEDNMIEALLLPVKKANGELSALLDGGALKYLIDNGFPDVGDVTARYLTIEAKARLDEIKRKQSRAAAFQNYRDMDPLFDFIVEYACGGENVIVNPGALQTVFHKKTRFFICFITNLYFFDLKTGF